MTRGKKEEGRAFFFFFIKGRLNHFFFLLTTILLGLVEMTKILICHFEDSFSLLFIM